MQSRESVELAIRAANVAKKALALLGVQSKSLAKLHMQELAKDVMELDKFVEKLT